MNILDELNWRGLIADCTDTAELTKRLAASPITLYCGFDPTADSLHVGNLVPLLALRRFQNLGHHPIAVAGGATGSIGDPSGKSQERQLLTKETLAANIASVKSQLARLLDFDTKTHPARLVDNASWTAPISFLDFLRDIGKHFSVNMMVSKESVRARMEDRDVGISYTEFSYLLLQAYDFLELHRRDGCTLQIGGSDQWGNITAGIDLIRRVTGEQAHGVVFPLLTTSSGTKFGKTEAGTVWLDAKRTSPFRFYQFWINAADEDALRYLGLFTLLGQAEVAGLQEAATADPGARHTQKALAEEVTRRVHGEDGLGRARQATAALFGGELEGLSADEIADIFADVLSSEVERGRLTGEGIAAVDLLAGSGLVPSKGEARRSIEGGGIYVNGRRVDDVDARITIAQAVEGRFLVLRKGKKNYQLVRVVG